MPVWICPRIKGFSIFVLTITLALFDYKKLGWTKNGQLITVKE